MRLNSLVVGGQLLPVMENASLSNFDPGSVVLKATNFQWDMVLTHGWSLVITSLYNFSP